MRATTAGVTSEDLRWRPSCDTRSGRTERPLSHEQVCEHGHTASVLDRRSRMSRPHSGWRHGRYSIYCLPRLQILYLTSTEFFEWTWRVGTAVQTRLNVRGKWSIKSSNMSNEGSRLGDDTNDRLLPRDKLLFLLEM